MRNKFLPFLVSAFVVLFCFTSFADTMDIQNDSPVTLEEVQEAIEDVVDENIEGDSLEVSEDVPEDENEYYDEYEDSDDEYAVFLSSPLLDSSSFPSSESIESSGIYGGNLDYMPCDWWVTDFPYAEFIVYMLQSVASLLMAEPFMWFTGAFLLLIVVGVFRRLTGH